MPKYGSPRKKTPRRTTHRGFEHRSHQETGVFFDSDHLKKHKNAEKKKAYELRKTAKWKKRVAKEGKCSYCMVPLSLESATMDHVVPLSRGGKTTMSNILVACKRCNTHKHSRTAVEWLVFDQRSADDASNSDAASRKNNH